MSISNIIVPRKKKKQTIQSPNFLNEELISFICDVLPQQDIISVIGTCKFWYQMATPRLYKRIIINGSQCHDNQTLTKLQFDQVNDLKFDSWLNFKIPIQNLSKLYQSLNANKRLISHIEEVEVFDCYKTELRFYILQILELILQNSEHRFQNFKCHHTTSNQFYYQCLCYQDYWLRLVKYVDKTPGNAVNNLCLNFNDFVRYFLNDKSCYTDVAKIRNFEIIINSYELNKLVYKDIDDYNMARFFHNVEQLTINMNFEHFASFANRYDYKFDKLKTLNINLSYMNDDVLNFCDKLQNLTKLSLNFENEDELEDEYPEKLLNKISRLDLNKVSIKLNNPYIYQYLCSNFPNLTNLSILNNFNDRHISNFINLVQSKRHINYLNYQFEISPKWLKLHRCHCDSCNELCAIPNHDNLVKIFLAEILSLISPKHCYKYLDQDLDLNIYPIGKITAEIMHKINRDYNIDITLQKSELILKYLVHALELTFLSEVKDKEFEYLSIAGLPFDKNKRCLIRV